MLDPALEIARNRARHAHARLALERVLGVCQKAGIDVLPVKGILTAHLFYADPGQRPIQDIDLRVRPRDLGPIRRAGAGAGWRQLSRSMAYGTLGFDVLGFLVEFESHVGPPGLCGLSIDQMLRRATPCVDPFGMPHLQPEIHDHALLGCVNAFKDKIVDAPPWALRDLEIVPGQAGFSPQRLAALARECGTTSIVWIVASWLASASDSSSWREVREQLGSAAPRRAYAQVFNRAIRARHPQRQVLRLLARAGSDDRSQRMLALCAMLLEGIESSVRRVRRGRMPTMDRPGDLSRWKPRG